MGTSVFCSALSLKLETSGCCNGSKLIPLVHFFQGLVKAIPLYLGGFEMKLDLNGACFIIEKCLVDC